MGVLQGDPAGLDGDPQGASPPCFWLFPVGEMLDHPWAWLDISAGVWLLPGHSLSSDLVFGVVIWWGDGARSLWDEEPGRAGMQGERAGLVKLPFSSPFKLSLNSKPAGVCVCGVWAVPTQPSWSGEPSNCPPVGCLQLLNHGKT